MRALTLRVMRWWDVTNDDRTRSARCFAAMLPPRAIFRVMMPDDTARYARERVICDADACAPLLCCRARVMPQRLRDDAVIWCRCRALYASAPLLFARCAMLLRCQMMLIFTPCSFDAFDAARWYFAMLYFALPYLFFAIDICWYAWLFCLFRAALLRYIMLCCHYATLRAAPCCPSAFLRFIILIFHFHLFSY